jgi:putative acetyltransferase
VTIRPERPEDFDAIRALHLAAFAPSTVETELVDALRAAGDHVPELCLVAPGGHVMVSRADVEGREVLALGPIAVEPARQRQGIGSALMRAVIERAAAYPLIGLLGHPGFYPRFGFRPGRTLGITSDYTDGDEWMVLPLGGYDPGIRGRFRYAPAF